MGGPVFMNPDRLLVAFSKEVPTRNARPFYAGFGNRETDARSYKAAGISGGKIFTINPQGQISIEKATSYRKTYSTMRELVDTMFPSLTSRSVDSLEEFNDRNYWKPTFDAPVPA